jgi:hypothetical protein
VTTDYIEPSPATWPLPERATITVLARAAMEQQRQENEEFRAQEERDRIEMEEQRRESSVIRAAKVAALVLGPEAAEQLTWAGTGSEVETEAISDLPGVPNAVLRYSETPLGIPGLEIVWGCPTCGTHRRHDVHSLAQLGELLASGIAGGAE